MDFQTLAIISVIALLGPLLATPRRWNIPVVIGQLAAGVIVGRTGLGLIDAADPTLTLLADVGFALIMFVALFFVWLGASLALRDLADHPEMIALGLALGLATLLTHSTTLVLGLPLSHGLLSAAQLGIPIASATIGTQLHVLAPGEAAAVLLGALVTIAVTAVASGWAKPRAASASEGTAS